MFNTSAPLITPFLTGKLLNKQRYPAQSLEDLITSCEAKFAGVYYKIVQCDRFTEQYLKSSGLDSPLLDQHYEAIYDKFINRSKNNSDDTSKSGENKPVAPVYSDCVLRFYGTLKGKTLKNNNFHMAPVG